MTLVEFFMTYRIGLTGPVVKVVRLIWENLLLKEEAAGILATLTAECCIRSWSHQKALAASQRIL